MRGRRFVLAGRNMSEHGSLLENAFITLYYQDFWRFEMANSTRDIIRLGCKHV